MPDWLTHIFLALLFAEVLNVKKKSLVVLGAILPDLLPKLVLMKLFIQIPNFNYGFLSAFHIPFVLFLITLLIAPIFKYNYRKVVLWLNLGALTHFLADATLRHFGGCGVKLLFPLSLNKYTLNLVWPNQSYLILIPVLLVYFLVLLYKKRKARIAKNKGYNKLLK